MLILNRVNLSNARDTFDPGFDAGSGEQDLVDHCRTVFALVNLQNRLVKEKNDRSRQPP